MKQDITLASTGKVTLKARTSIGSYQVAMARYLQEAVGDWSLILLPKAMSANVSKVLVFFRYMLSYIFKLDIKLNPSWVYILYMFTITPSITSHLYYLTNFIIHEFSLADINNSSRKANLEF